MVQLRVQDRGRRDKPDTVTKGANTMDSTKDAKELIRIGIDYVRDHLPKPDAHEMLVDLGYTNKEVDDILDYLDTRIIDSRGA